jgi:tRNA-uridine 2-sulfurtransferase
MIGEHDGIAFYTLGQRKGLGIGGPGDAWFVVAKDPVRNVVVIEQGDDHPALYRDFLLATDLSWVSGTAPGPLPYSCSAKVRYRQPEQPCVIEKIEDGTAHIRFLQPQRAITPRQSIVFYDGEQCLGGGMIAPFI